MGAIIFLLVVFAPYGLAFVLGLILLFKCLGANDILAIISTKSKHKLMTRYFHNYVLIYRTVLPAHENVLIVQKHFLPSA
uniref:Uncharacterized protein n=1 Tax=Kingella negevensis TaxID=1522312 RepID=A0A238HIQ5_9NEIS